MTGDEDGAQTARSTAAGLVRGLATTAKALLRPAHTAEYPDVLPALPPRSRGVIALLHENCTSCMLCARECPDWCIYIDSHKETIPAVDGGRERQRNVLDRFAIDFSLCMYCGICIEVCPFDALFWSPEFEYAELDIKDLLHEKDRLGGWMNSVPPPQPPDVAAPEPKEVAASQKPARPARPAATSATAAAAVAGAAEAPATGTPAPPAVEVIEPTAVDPGPRSRPAPDRGDPSGSSDGGDAPAPGGTTS